MESTIQQFFSFNVVIIAKEGPKGYPYNIFKSYVPEYLPAIERSLQFKEKWDNSTIDMAQRIVVFSCFLLLSYLFLFRRFDGITSTQQKIMIVILLALLGNALICGGVSMVAPRFQSRIIWLLPLYSLLMIYYVYQHKDKKFS